MDFLAQTCFTEARKLRPTCRPSILVGLSRVVMGMCLRNLEHVFLAAGSHPASAEAKSVILFYWHPSVTLREVHPKRTNVTASTEALCSPRTHRAPTSGRLLRRMDPQKYLATITQTAVVEFCHFNLTLAQVSYKDREVCPPFCA